jgi:hypothetical protein
VRMAGIGPLLWPKALTEKHVAADIKLVQFVGIKPYETAGGAVLRDLFDDDNFGLAHRFRAGQLSALAGGLLGFTAMLPFITVLGLSVIAGFIVQGNFSNLTSGSSQSPLPSTGGDDRVVFLHRLWQPHSSARSCSASRSISSAGYRSWPRGSSASAPADSLA